MCGILAPIQQAYADLLISPTRVAFDERSRSETVTLINSGEQTRSYRIEWRQMAALPQGGYRELTEQEKKRYAGLEQLVRVSPKQVTLAPGERQTVKLLLRSSGNLTAGEYRSHLVFSALPIPGEVKPSQGASITLNVLMSYSIPVLYRIGAVKVAPKIDDISLVTKRENNVTYIKVSLSHQDAYSTHGRLVAFWTPTGGKTRQVGILNNYNFYPETPTAQVQFPWDKFRLEPGSLEVRFEGQSEYSGLLLSSRTLNITSQMIQSIR